MRRMKRISTSVAQTEAVAAELATTLHGGECLALHGEMGAGKTQFVRGLLRGLGGNPRTVSSPTATPPRSNGTVRYVRVPWCRKMRSSHAGS